MSKESISRLAALTGMARETVAKRLAELTPVIDGAAKKFESREALPILYDLQSDGNYDLTEERARLSFHQANLESMKEREQKGKLIPADLVVLFGSGMIASARSKMLGAHSKIKSRFPQLEQSVINEIENIHHEALSELGNDGLPAELRERIYSSPGHLDATTKPDD